MSDLVDFSECEFISKEMWFYTYPDFGRNCDAIKRLYNNNLSKNAKVFYKWYCYANIHTTMNQKNRIWDYINSYCDKNDLKALLKK